MKQTYELIAPCHFGLEAVLKKEILDLGYEISQVEMEELLLLAMMKQSAVPMYFYALQSVSC